MILFADVMRVMVLVNLVAVMALSWWTLRSYVRRLKSNEPRNGLSKHVVKVSLSHVGLIAAFVAYTSSRFGQPMTLQLPAVLISSTLTLSALWDLTFFQAAQKRTA